MRTHRHRYRGRSLTGGRGYRICVQLFRAAVRAVEARAATLRALRRTGRTLAVAGRTFDLDAVQAVYVIGCGKASAAMAQAVEMVLGDAITAGVVVTKYGQCLPTKTITVREASHPTPDEAGVAATAEVLDLCDAAGPDDLVLCLVSGGGSALFECPVEGVTLADVRETTQLLLHAGAPITALNTVRKHLSAVKGGQLARRVAPAALVTLVLSDVIGDPLDVIASGPTVPDATTFADALDVLDQYGLRGAVPEPVRQHLEAGARGVFPDTPFAGEPFFANTRTAIIANAQRALDAVARAATAAGYPTIVLSNGIEGEASVAARIFAGIACQARTYGQPLPGPCCVLAGGETTVTVHGSGVGGRNTEFALAAALALRDTDGIVIGSLATDGGDGPTDAGGAVATSHTVARARTAGMDAAAFLRNNDAYTFFARAGGLVSPGPTNTNVNDLMIALIEGAGATR